MKQDEKFIEVLSEIVKKLMKPNEKNDIEEIEKKIVESLVEKGYQLDEISDILEDIFKVINSDYEKEMKIRILHPYELENLNEDAKKYLLYLRKEQMITEKEFEIVLNDVSSRFVNVDLATLKTILNKNGLYVDQYIN